MNYNDIIEAAFKEGADFERIAADFSKALNSVEKMKKEETAKREARMEFMDLLFENVDHWVDDGFGDALAAAANLAAWDAGDTHVNWSADRLRQFRNDAYEQLQALVSLYEMEDKGEPVARVLRKGLDLCSSKSKEKENSDEDTLRDFLRQLGL